VTLIVALPELPFLTPARNPAFAGVRVKAQPEDFIVEELALYEPCGEGSHTYFWIEKRGLNTHDAARKLAQALSKRAPDAGIAGLKDAQAVTRQWISFEHVAPGQLAALDLSPGARVLKTSRHGNKLRMGHLRGNRFELRLRLAEASAPVGELAQAARGVFDELTRRGIPNYYGPQRFGRDGRNPALGKLLVQGNEEAFRAALPEVGISPGKVRDGKLRNLLVNAYQAELFNRVLARRMPDLGTLQTGDLACLARNGAVFLVEDAAKEQPRCDSFEVSPSGPLYGPKMRAAEGAPGALEQAVLAESGVSAADFGRAEAERQPGARRPLRIVFLEPPSVQEEADAVVVRFALPSGAYATVVLRELLGDAPLGALPEG